MLLRPSRRQVLTGAAAAGLTVVLATAERSTASADPDPGPEAGPAQQPSTEKDTTVDLDHRLSALEQRHSARLGVFAQDTGTGRTVRYRAEELFPFCSTFKTIAVAAVLRDLDRDGTYLAKVIRYSEQEVKAAGYAPITGQPANLANGMAVADLCAAAIRYSDNCAANLLLRELGGPTAVTRFCRSVGDRTTRLDRWEPALNSAEPGRVTDTSSPAALGRTYARLTLGDALDAPDRARLTDWLKGNTTSTHRFRAGLPESWTLADKTGTGDYGTTNDAGLTWPPGRAPIVLTVLATKQDQAAPADEPLIAATAALLAEALA
ncbi:Class A beta-lactamase [Kitasatospora sp. MMS16-BH015]|uniref:class A beta-lactamase n=1 Tax=Kitasatospora sp. MMS16-BH015 TaxID=2018025 RepID=UPI000CA1DC5C|nr:class A beta-lactamase [Kitasatospora sp. MMS16-BH015]AUG81329.1 Class A beta-lactamase [Kitasatospora sp. MMS16-BH015]